LKKSFRVRQVLDGFEGDGGVEGPRCERERLGIAPNRSKTVSGDSEGQRIGVDVDAYDFASPRCAENLGAVSGPASDI